MLTARASLDAASVLHWTDAGRFTRAEAATARLGLLVVRPSELHRPGRGEASGGNSHERSCTLLGAGGAGGRGGGGLGLAGGSQAKVEEGNRHTASRASPQPAADQPVMARLAGSVV